MSVRAQCGTCRRTFELPPEAATPGRHCQYCGGDLSISQSSLPTVQAARRADAIVGHCPICDFVVRFEPGQRAIRCDRCGTDITEPDAPGGPARVAPPPMSGIVATPPVSVPCAHCGGRGRMALEMPRPNVHCEQCGKALTAAYLPLEKWADVRTLATPGTLGESLLLILRGRWNLGTVSAGEVLRHVEGLRLVTGWLQQKPEERTSDFPLPVGSTAEVLKYFVLRVDKAEIQSQSKDRVILVVPTRREEPRESDTKMRRRDEEGVDRSGPTMILSIGAVPSGSVFGFLAQGADGTTGALAESRLAEVKELIATMIPRASFRFLAYRFLFGEWMRPATMVFVPPAVTERELRKLGLPDARVKSILERLAV
jgi:hypothetical protein